MKNVYLLLIVILAGSCSRNDMSDAYGNFEATEVTVSSEANGRILSFIVEEGIEIEDKVTVGLVDTTTLYLQKLQLIRQKQAVKTRIPTIESQIRVHEQQLKNLGVEKNRIDRLFAEGAATQKQLDDINGQLDLLMEQIVATRVQKESVIAEAETIRVQIMLMEDAMQKCRIINPVSGTVLAKYAEAGEITAFGKPLYKIANLEALELKVFISGDQLPHISIGQEVKVLIDEDAKENRQLSGKVSWISQKAEFTPKTIQTKEERVNQVYAVKVIVQNDGRLKVGMPGEINFMPEEEENK